MMDDVAEHGEISGQINTPLKQLDAHTDEEKYSNLTSHTTSSDPPRPDIYAHAAVSEEMSARIRKMPKVELHCHLEGAVYYDTLIDIYTSEGLTLAQTELERRQHFLMRSPVHSLQNFLDIATRSAGVLVHIRNIRRIARELVVRKYFEGVKLLEIRYSPPYISRYTDASKESVLEAIKHGVDEGCAQVDHEIHVGLICVADTVEGEKAFEETANFCIKHREDFVGFDHAGPEIDLTPYAHIFDKVHKHDIPITIHAAEDMQTGKPSNALTAVRRLHARRIGHGINIINDNDILNYIKQENILLEVCPSSNYVTGGCQDIKNHPIRQLYDMGVRVCINTDDPGLMCSDLNGEYELLHKWFDFGEREFIQMNSYALEQSFLSEEKKQLIKKQYFDPFI